MIICIVNSKGGTGKTTTCVNLSAALANAGSRTLVVDLDAQACASLSFGVRWSDMAPSSADVLFGGVDMGQAIRPTGIPRLDILTGDTELANSDLLLGDMPGRENRFADCVESVRSDYDFVLCDCPPSLSLLSVNALVAADACMVPMALEYLSLEGLITLLDAMEKIKAGMDISPPLLGIVFTMVNRSAKMTRDIADLVREQFGNQVFKTEIARDIRLCEAPSFGQTIFDYAPKSRGATLYANLAREVAERASAL